MDTEFAVMVCVIPTAMARTTAFGVRGLGRHWAEILRLVLGELTYFSEVAQQAWQPSPLSLQPRNQMVVQPKGLSLAPPSTTMGRNPLPTAQHGRSITDFHLCSMTVPGPLLCRVEQNSKELTWLLFSVLRLPAPEYV